MQVRHALYINKLEERLVELIFSAYAFHSSKNGGVTEHFNRTCKHRSTSVHCVHYYSCTVFCSDFIILAVLWCCLPQHGPIRVSDVVLGDPVCRASPESCWRGWRPPPRNMTGRFKWGLEFCCIVRLECGRGVTTLMAILLLLAPVSCFHTLHFTVSFVA